MQQVNTHNKGDRHMEAIRSSSNIMRVQPVKPVRPVKPKPRTDKRVEGYCKRCQHPIREDHDILSFKRSGLCSKCLQVLSYEKTKRKEEQANGVDLKTSMSVTPEPEKELSNAAFNLWMNRGNKRV